MALGASFLLQDGPACRAGWGSSSQPLAVMAVMACPARKALTETQAVTAAMAEAASLASLGLQQPLATRAARVLVVRTRQRILAS